MTVSLAGFESVSAKTRFVVPELPSTTTASLASRKGRVCAGALRLTRQSSRKRAIRRLQLFREKLEAPIIHVRVRGGEVWILSRRTKIELRACLTLPRKEKTPLTRGFFQKSAAYFLRRSQTKPERAARPNRVRVEGSGTIV